MTASTSNSSAAIPTDLNEAKISDFLQEHGEIEMIVPVVIGILVTSRFQLRGSQALLANLLIATAVRKVLEQLKHQSMPFVEPENSTMYSYHSTEEYTIIHQVPGRLRLRMARLATDPNFAHRLERRLTQEEQVINVRINCAAASIVIIYDSQGLNEVQLGMRLLEIVNEAIYEKNDSENNDSENN